MRSLQIADTHLYPGCRGSMEPGDMPTDAEPVTLVFSDGAMAPGMIEDDVLKVEAYETASGTAIAAKAWVVSLAHGALRIVRRQS